MMMQEYSLRLFLGLLESYSYLEVEVKIDVVGADDTVICVE